MNIEEIFRLSSESAEAVQEAVGQPIEDFIQGRWLDPTSRTIFLTEYIYPIPYRHGNVDISHGEVPAILKRWSRISPHVEVEAGRLLFIDTETTGLAGGTGTFAFMVGMGYYEGDSFVVRQYFLEQLAAEKDFWKEAIPIMEAHPVLVSYNGKPFDIPLIQSRLRLSQFEYAIRTQPHIDILPLMRRFWRTNLENCSLDCVESGVLKYYRPAGQDIAGFQIPRVYFQYLEDHNGEQIAAIFHHNRDDILSLAALFWMTASICLHPVQEEYHPLLDVGALARFFNDMVQSEMATRILAERYTRVKLSIVELMLLADLYKRDRKWVQAHPLWVEAAKQQHIPALVELAKEAEHHLKDYLQAIFYTSQAMDLERATSFPNTKTVSALAKRLQRLQEKCFSKPTAESK